MIALQPPPAAVLSITWADRAAAFAIAVAAPSALLAQFATPASLTLAVTVWGGTGVPTHQHTAAEIIDLAGLTNVTAFVAEGAISGHMVVRARPGGKVALASNNVPAHAGSAFGITTGAAVDGAVINVQTAGPMVEPSWAWTPELPVYLGTNGGLTQTPPSVAGSFAMSLGVATSPTSLQINFKPAIALA